MTVILAALIPWTNLDQVSVIILYQAVIAYCESSPCYNTDDKAFKDLYETFDRDQAETGCVDSFLAETFNCSVTLDHPSHHVVNSSPKNNAS